MDSFRKAHSSITLTSKLPKGTNSKDATSRLKLKKLLFDFSKNNLESIRKEAMKEISDETLNDSSLDSIKDSNNFNYIDDVLAEVESNEDFLENTSPKRENEDSSNEILSNSDSHSPLHLNASIGRYVLKPQPNKQFKLGHTEPEISDVEIELSERNVKNVDSCDTDLSELSDELDSSNESNVSSEQKVDLVNESTFDKSGELASAIKEKIALSVSKDDESDSSTMDDTSPNTTHSKSYSKDVTTMVYDPNRKENHIKDIFSNYISPVGRIEQKLKPASITDIFKLKKNNSQNFKIFIPNIDPPPKKQKFNDEQHHDSLQCKASVMPLATNNVYSKTNMDETATDLEVAEDLDNAATDLDDTATDPDDVAIDLDDTANSLDNATTDLDGASTDLDDIATELDGVTTDFDDTATTCNGHSQQNSQLTNGREQFHNDVRIIITRNGCVVVIKYPSCMYIAGKVIVRSLCGHVEIFGYKLDDNPVAVFSARYNPSMRIKTFPDEGDKYGLFGKLTSLGLSVAKTEDIVTSISLHDAVLFLEPMKDTLCPFIETHWSLMNKVSEKAYTRQHPDLFSKTTSYNDEEFIKASKNLVDCSLYANTPAIELPENPLWDSLVQMGREKNSVAFITGRKNIGKSTLLRYYVNKLLAQGPVAVLDLDPGQSEFTIAGNISITVVKKPLLGPNFTHLQAPNIMLNLGLINVMDNIEKYTRALQQIAVHLQSEQEYKDLPWVVNTMGFTEGVGLKLLAYTILLLKPTVVAQLSGVGDKIQYRGHLSPGDITYALNYEFNNDELFDFLALKNLTENERKVDYKFIEIEHDIRNQYKFSQAKQQRYLNALGYFSQVLNKSNNFILNGAKPFIVSRANIKFGFNVLVPENMIFHVLNAKIVALCKDDKEENKLGKTFHTGDYANVCYGHGIVRGVDLERGLLYVITPVALSTLQYVNALVYEEHSPDLQLGSSELRLGTHVPYRESVNTAYHANLVKAAKRRFNPMHLLRNKRQNY